MRKFVLILICTILLTLCGCGRSWGYMNRKMNHKSFGEIAAKLRELGIDGINDQMIQDLENGWDQIPYEIRASLDKTAYLLDVLGRGNYDFETLTYTPSSEDVYAFDMEVFNETEMYRDFLRGVAAIGNGELDFTEMEENLEGVDWEAGTGSRGITFKWQGNLYTLEGKVMGDWFDFSVADQLNQMIMEQQEGKRLYFGSDGYQSVYVFYRDAEWAAAFTKATGMQLVETF